MHAAKLENSPRLQRVHELLSDGLPHSSWEITEKARVAAVGTCVSELCKNGFTINHVIEEGIHYYTMEVTGDAVTD